MKAKESWPIVRLGQAIQSRKEFVTVDDLTEYKRCRVQLRAKGIVLRDIVQGAEIRTKQQQVCRRGEFLVAEIDAKVGGFGIVPDELDGAIVSSHYFLYEINEHWLNRRFLDYYIRTRAFHDQVEAQGSTNYAAIRPQHVLEYTIPLPPLAEQQRIVARIDALAVRIDEARRLRAQAVGEVKAVMGAAQAHVFLGGHYDIVHLESVCHTIVDCLHSNPVFSDEGVPTVRSSDVGWGTLDIKNARRTSYDEYVRRTQRGAPQVDDIIFVREGGGVGKAGIVLEGQHFSLGQRIMMIRPNKSKILPRFFLFQLLSPLVYREQILERIKGSASPHLNINALRKFSIILPNVATQHRMVAHLDSLQTKVDAVRRLQAETQAELDALLPSVLDRAFRGEL